MSSKSVRKFLNYLGYKRTDDTTRNGGGGGSEKYSSFTPFCTVCSVFDTPCFTLEFEQFIEETVVGLIEK